MSLASSAIRVLVIPGFNGSGPDHWQTRWIHRRDDCTRVDQANWHDPDPLAWAAQIEIAVAATPAPVVLVAHSLGCAAVAHWLAGGGNEDRIGGALLVAPCDVERADLPAAIARFAPLPALALPFRSLVVASTNDPYATLARARGFADRWGSAFVNAGALGHINAASALEDWHFGQVLLDDLVATARCDRLPYQRAARLRAARLRSVT